VRAQKTEKIAQPERVAVVTDRTETADRLSQLSHLSPDDRRRVLAGLPSDQRQRLEDGLGRLEHLSVSDREQLLNRYKRFEELPAAQQEAVRNVMRQFGALPESRRNAVKQELELLKHLPEPARESRLRSSGFKNRFTPSERQMIHLASTVLPDQI
jgi:hypothetical protein